MAPKPHRPRKRFGQHFLHDPQIIQRIVSAIAPRPGDTLVEIGPGHGALTYPLLDAAERLQAVEIDRDLIAELRAAAPRHGELLLHEADALRFPFCTLADNAQRLRIVGNLPYNISTPLLFHLLNQAHCIQDMHFMLQQEVVQRMTAAPGGRDYGRLSVMLQYHCAATSLLRVRPGAFRPPPKVDSAVVRLVPHAQAPVVVEDEARFARVVAVAFQQRRKTLRNALRTLLDEATIRAAGVDPQVRPDQLDLEQYARLSNA